MTLNRYLICYHREGPNVENTDLVKRDLIGKIIEVKQQKLEST